MPGFNNCVNVYGLKRYIPHFLQNIRNPCQVVRLRQHVDVVHFPQSDVAVNRFRQENTLEQDQGYPFGFQNRQEPP